MSKTILILLIAIAACAAAASPASATPPVGAQYCMDGNETFWTWDALAANVTDVIVNVFGGVLTLGEVDPANVGRPAVQQYWDALETSDAIGSPGVDTTIPNYVVHHIAVGACPRPPENHVFLCYSKFQVDPGAWPASQAEELINEGYWSPSAMSGNLAGGTNIGDLHLVCNPPAATSQGPFVGSDGKAAGVADPGLPGYYRYAG
ncbi:MAG: hypothetical protein ACRDL2_03285 [Gaiellaceae bacterium]